VVVIFFPGGLLEFGRLFRRRRPPPAPPAALPATDASLATEGKAG
jgi:hypothetical protein